jgi:hypothetical protein
MGKWDERPWVYRAELMTSCMSISPLPYHPSTTSTLRSTSSHPTGSRARPPTRGLHSFPHLELNLRLSVHR